MKTIHIKIKREHLDYEYIKYLKDKLLKTHKYKNIVFSIKNNIITFILTNYKIWRTIGE